MKSLKNKGLKPEISLITEVEDSKWEEANRLSTLAYDTFRSRWFAPGAIHWLNAQTNQDVDMDGTNDVDELPTLANLSDAITKWGGPANKLTVL